MKRWNLLSILLLAAVACGGGDEAEPTNTAEDQAPAAQAQEPAVEQPAAPAQQPVAAPPRQMPRETGVSMPVVDEPWFPTDTGTVNPGMTRDEVIAVWGKPVTERTMGAWTYLYFRNGCEASCGTFDVVFLDNGQVVNAIVRGRGHTYGGASTSPAGTEAKANIPRGMEG